MTVITLKQNYVNLMTKIDYLLTVSCSLIIQSISTDIVLTKNSTVLK